MSKAFTKEDDDGALPLPVPQRAPLPPGVPNYVTPRGLGLLKRELAALEAERAQLAARAGGEDERAESERRRALAVLQAQKGELEARIATAVPFDAASRPPGEVRFGTTVSVRGDSGPPRTYTLVGVDEARASEGRIAFTAPLARALLGKRVGEVVTVRTPRGEEELEVVAIALAE